MAIATDDVRLIVDADDGATSYAFTCPACKVHRNLPAEPPTAEFLQSLGVVMEIAARRPEPTGTDVSPS